jgi:hypothetical protein
VRPGNLDDFRHALRLTHTLWGGRFNPIIPVGLPFDRVLVKAFAVDVLLPAAQVAELVDFSKSFGQLYWPDAMSLVFPDGARSTSPIFVDVRRPIETIRQERDRERAILRQAYLFAPTVSDPLHDVLLAMFGGYPSPDEVGVDYTNIFGAALRAESVGTAIIGPGISTAITPSDIASWELKPFDPQVQFDGHTGLYLGSAASHEDLAAFWNLRAAGLDLRFFDRTHSERMKWITDEWLRPLIERSASGKREDEIGVWSRSESEFDAKPETGERWVGRLVDDSYWSQLPVLPHYHWNEQRILASLALDPVPQYSFQLPAKPMGEQADPLQTIGVTVRVQGDLVHSARDTFLVPGISGLNMLFSERMYPAAPFSVRISRNYFTLCISAAEDQLTIQAAKKSDLISELLKVFGIHAELSQPGVIAMRLIDQMGGLEGCGLFRFPGVRQLIERYTPLQHFTRSGAIECIRDLEPGTNRSRFADYLPSGARWTAQFVLDHLLERRVFHAGLEFRCPNCNLEFWTPIGSVGTEVTCELCGVRFNCTPQLKDRDWRFRRSGLFGKEDHQEGSIPVVLTLRQLNATLGRFGMQQLIFTTAMKLEPISAPIRSCETDFAFLNKSFRGPLNFVIGECKSAFGEITQGDLDNLASVASAIPPDQLKVFILLAKTGVFTADEVDRCKKTASALPDRVIMLSQRELQAPLLTYEWAAREFNVSATATTLEDMARQTDGIFFNPRPRP